MMRAVSLVQQKGEQDQLWNRDCRLLAVNKNPAHFHALSRQRFFWGSYSITGSQTGLDLLYQVSPIPYP